MDCLPLQWFASWRLIYLIHMRNALAGSSYANVHRHMGDTNMQRQEMAETHRLVHTQADNKVGFWQFNVTIHDIHILYISGDG